MRLNLRNLRIPKYHLKIRFMLRIRLLFLSFVSFCTCLHGIDYPEKFEGRFEGWGQKRLELIGLFLPSHPVILLAGGYNSDEMLSFATFWPSSTLIIGDSNNLDEWAQENGIDQIDIGLLDLRQSAQQTLSRAHYILSTATCIYVKTNFLPSRTGMQYAELREFLEGSGFRLLAHWYKEGFQGEAIFIRGNFYDGYPSNGIIDKTWDGIKKNYKRCYVHYPNAIFYIDDVPDSIKTFLRNGYPWEGNTGLIIEEFSKEGSITIDIGAHIGVHTITMSKKVGPEGAVIAFEPQKKIYLELLQNLRFNNCTNVISICKALGETTKIAQMTQIDPTNEGGTAIGAKGDYIEMIPLDSLNLTNVSLIKIDVENYEFFTLQGARDTILRNKPVIVFEVNGSNLDFDPAKEEENYNRVMALINSYGYEIYGIHNKDFIAFPLNSNGEFSNFKKTHVRIYTSPSRI